MRIHFQGHQTKEVVAKPTAATVQHTSKKAKAGKKAKASQGARGNNRLPNQQEKRFNTLPTVIVDGQAVTYNQRFSKGREKKFLNEQTKENGNIICFYCDHRLLDLEEFVRHTLAVHPLGCVACNFVVRGLSRGVTSNKLKHMRVYHKFKIPNLSNHQPVNEKIASVLAALAPGSQLKQNRDVLQHLRRVPATANGLDYICPHCFNHKGEKAYFNRDGYLKHVKAEHPGYCELCYSIASVEHLQNEAQTVVRMAPPSRPPINNSVEHVQNEAQTVVHMVPPSRPPINNSVEHVQNEAQTVVHMVPPSRPPINNNIAKAPGLMRLARAAAATN